MLHISQAAGGVQRHVIDIVSRLDKNMFEIVGACPPQDLIKGVSADKESFIEAFKRAGVRAYPIKMCREIRPVGDLFSLFGIYKLIKKERFDIVHAHSSKAGFLARVAAKLAGVPVIVYTPNNFAFDRPGYMAAQRIFYSAIERLAGLFCDMVFAVCKDEKDLAVRLGVLPKEKITVISNVINASKLSPAVDVLRKHRELGIGESERVIISVGRAARQKSPKDFVLAAQKVLEKRKDVKFLFLGDGPLFKKTERLINRKKLSGNVKLLGWRNDASEVIAASDIFVLSSLWEVLPNHSLLDAMALSKPAVITAASGAREAVIDGFNGYVVSAGDYQALANAILKLLDLSNGELKKLGKHSKEMFEKRLTPEDVVKIIENTYTGLLYKKRKINA